MRLVSNPPADPSPPRERNLLQAYFFGCSVIYVAIGMTLLTVVLIMMACGVTFSWGDALWLLPAFVGAAILRLYARLASTP